MDKITHLNYTDLPKINGEYITDIYAKELPFPENCKHSYYAKDGYYVKGVEYYECHTYFGNKRIKVKTLPNTIASLFGRQIRPSDKSKIFVTSIHFKEHKHHYGGVVNLSGINSGGCNDSIDIDLTIGEVGKLLGRIKKIEIPKQCAALIIGKEFSVDELPWWHGVEFDCSYIRTEGGLNYPDVKCEGWRWSYGSPYISQNQNDRNNIRVYSELMNAHVYFEKAIPKKGDTDLFVVRFPRDHDKKGDQFCHIGTWREPKEFIRHTIQSMNRDGRYVKVVAMNGDKAVWKGEEHIDHFYNLTAIRKIA